jgi:stearoyl-CoA desaturase (Delta-9 desaturase)
VVEIALDRPRIDWKRCVPFILLHIACLSVFWVGWSQVAVATAAVTYFTRVFGLTAFYHRYFSHRSFKTSRWFQFVGALLGSAAGQRGPIWWAAHHRDHHRHSDQPGDVHSPHQHGFWFSHMGWFMTREYHATRERNVPDLLRYPELRFLERYDFLIAGLLAVAMYAWGAFLAWFAPQLGTTGPQMLVWGFLLSTIFLYHVTYSINSIAHVFGTRRYATRDDSRNNLWLALVTFGEGWHNNHHYYPAAARQGFYWWEIDVTYYVLVLLSWLGLVWDLKAVPARVLAAGRPSAPEPGSSS